MSDQANLSRSDRALSAAAALAPLLHEKCILLDELHARSLVARINDAARAGTDTTARRAMESDSIDELSYVRTVAGVAVIPIIGILTKYSNWFDDWCGFCPTVVLLDQLARALRDPEVKAIAFDVDSPGGFVNGTVEFADAVAAASKIKPTIAIVRGMCCSGAYWIASQCTSIISRRESEVGNIGVYSVLADISAFYAEIGVALTTVASGEFKGLGADGKVTETMISDTRRIITGLYQQFVSAVAIGRELDPETATAIADGKSYLGPQAKQLGLIDEIASSFDAAIEAAVGSPASGAANSSKERSMSTPDAGAAGNAAKVADDAASPPKEDVHTTLNKTVTSANRHKDQARACLDTCNQYTEDAGDDTMDLAKQAISALRASADESNRAADAWEAKMTAEDEPGEYGGDKEGDGGDEGGDSNARSDGNRAQAGKPATTNELLSAFPGDKAFCMDQMVAGATMAQAYAAHGKHLASKIKELERKLDAANGQAPVGFNGENPAPVAGTVGVTPEEAAAQAKKEWSANAGDCRNLYIDEPTYVAVRKREQAGTLTASRAK